jgi:hypothetical protein
VILKLIILFLLSLFDDNRVSVKEAANTTYQLIVSHLTHLNKRVLFMQSTYGVEYQLKNPSFCFNFIESAIQGKTRNISKYTLAIARSIGIAVKIPMQSFKNQVKDVLSHFKT